ncbi:expressed unknown protein [Seminavis robusta]|uniref:Uncharacterized protein n=1 Tax=Seminavis robusta TaxID=568900 RepID=A0A9N8D8B7_9STRA|nr:expressed unknown protein [Seminavis robusta]|eukprot:Sro1_g000430.1 n/a (382) ;mRNA; f:119279-120424
MKFAITILLSALAAVSARSEIKVGDTLKANSKIGQKLISKARRLENADEDVEAMQWIADYSLKFQGCHHLVQWNEEADDEQDVRLFKKRLVRFRLCPSDTCSASDAGGCDEGYGDYIVDMQSYLQSYYESKRQVAEETCGDYAENYCNCEGNGDDNFNENQCFYECIVDAGMTDCVQYMEDNIHAEDFEIDQYMECAQFEYDNGNRKLEEAAFFVGPYCSEQGGSINLGMFSDDTCSTPIEDETYGAYTFQQMTGFSLPYAEKSIVGSECSSCLMVDENEDGNDNGDDQEVELTEVCEMAYMNAGKCEVNVQNSQYPNDNACNYIEGIKVVREDGMVFYQKAHANAVTTAFIVIFAMAFFAMGFYVWYLRTRLNVKPDALL